LARTPGETSFSAAKTTDLPKFHLGTERTVSTRWISISVARSRPGGGGPRWRWTQVDPGGPRWLIKRTLIRNLPPKHLACRVTVQAGRQAQNSLVYTRPWRSRITTVNEAPRKLIWVLLMSTDCLRVSIRGVHLPLSYFYYVWKPTLFEGMYTLDVSTFQRCASPSEALQHPPQNMTPKPTLIHPIL